MKKLSIIPFLLASYMGVGQTAATIIGTTIKIANLEVAQNDFPVKMTWDDAKKVCEALGDGWRLPTKDELNDLYKNRIKIGGFVANRYWCSLEEIVSSAWKQDFSDGTQYFANKLLNTCSVRAVRTIGVSK